MMPLRRLLLPLAALLLLSAALLSLCAAPRPSAAPAAPGDTVPNSAEARAARRNLPAQRGKPYVVLVSSDGFRHDFAELHGAPTLARMAREGARAERMVPTFPSKTFPNHYTLVTGMHADRHGLVGNEIFDPATGRAYAIGTDSAVTDPRWYGGEPAWVGAERQGMLSGVFFWPGSQAPIGGVLPTYVKPYEHEFPAAARVDTVLKWLGLPPERRPHFLALYFADVDDAAHEHGPRSREAGRAVARVDSMLARLLAGIARLPHGDSVTVIAVSDHGMTEVHGEMVYLADHLELDGVRVVSAGPYAQLFFGGDTARLERAYAALRGRLPHARVFRRGELPSRFAYENPRSGDLLVVMDPPWQVGRRRGERPAWDPARVAGTHGWDPAVGEMHAIFFARGFGIRPGARVGAFENVHVYPLLMHLLGLRPDPEAEGRLEVLRPVLREEAGGGASGPSPSPPPSAAPGAG